MLTKTPPIMKKQSFFGWSMVIMALGFAMIECHASALTQETPVNVSNSPLPTNINNQTVSPTNQAAADEEEDLFVPYAGERFSVFDWNLCKLMTSKYQGNLLISPISVKLALVLLYEGAQDQTAHELAEVMRLPVGRWATRNKFLVILRSLRPIFNEYKLDIGMRMYVSNEVPVKQSYGATIKTFYETDVIPTNLSNSQAAAAEINNWISNVTHNNIKKIIENDDSIKDAVMVLVNALYFQGSWHKNTFSSNATRFDKFHTPSKIVDVPFMNTIGNFYYSESLEINAKILRIRYVGHKFAMYFILPRVRGGLDQLIKNINPFLLTRHIWLMQNLPVEVKIPKFKFDFTSHLESTLREMGIRDIFDNTATLNGIARAKRDSRRLEVSDIVQKAGIEVNEQGTTAYATTEVQIGNKIGEQEFIADHPFLFYIEDEITGTILYMGRVSNPLEETGSTDIPVESPIVNKINTGVTSAPVPQGGTKSLIRSRVSSNNR